MLEFGCQFGSVCFRKKNSISIVRVIGADDLETIRFVYSKTWIIQGELAENVVNIEIALV